ncbi:hypothetical protein CYLTODRAFT_411136 [Cylindrobasidium torrendii FP15055 ss-10]|uniref:Uncharacterized protein n=1 Tax=Cylindrobasidium torrendii FP15055 ss-10 TaxID=1314674 RepID=A0A0D7BB88_9AGAR|nr:hypothetical protein CYLTODRAFT_411136 [Cylindrobasidium torrendii FP15055 ss-10]
MDQPVILMVELWYSPEAGIGPLASGTRGMDGDMTRKFRQHIQSLGIPPPRADSTSCTRPDIMETYWETTEHAIHDRRRAYTDGSSFPTAPNAHINRSARDKVVFRLFRLHSTHPTEPNGGHREGEEIRRHDIDNPHPSSSRSHWPLGESWEHSTKFKRPPPSSAPSAFRHDSVPPHTASGPRTSYTQHSPSTSLGKRVSLDDGSPEAKRPRLDGYSSLPRNPASQDWDSNHLQSRCEELERKLEASNKLNAILEARNKELEMLIHDVERECRQPFVVPLLLDAFVEVSKLTNAATNTTV